VARLQLSKSALSREQKSLATYQKFLPSLDLKRQQLMAERAKAARTLENTRTRIEALRKEVREKLRMLSNSDVDLKGLVTLTDIRIGSENVVGTRLPTLEAIEVEVQPYALLAKPHWIDNTAALLRDMLELRIRLRLDERRSTLLEKAVKTITQRVNLFDKVLIPDTRKNIKRIRIALADGEKAAVVRSKISKRKRAGVAPA
jgi:V/A-type H+/Na+-transporting ATPase subunit D